MKTYDVVVVGNGILGCSTALELTRRDSGLTVAVIGPEQRPGAASSAAGAMLSCFAEVTHRTLSSAPGRAKLEMSLRALEAWPGWVEALNEELPSTGQLGIRNGTYVVLNSRGGRLDSLNYHAILDAAAVYHRSVKDVPFGEVPYLNPVLDARPLEAVYLPDEGAIDARRVLAAVTAVARRHGVDFIDDTVAGWGREGQRATSVVLRSGERIGGGRFLVAAGAASHALLDELADAAAPIPPILAGKGVAVTCRYHSAGLEQVVRTPNRAGGCGLHMIPGTEGTAYLGATNDLMLQPDRLSTVGMVHFLLGCAMEQLDNRLFRSEIVRWHVGNRPGSLDGFPLVGRVWQENVWLLTGTYRDGFHCSPLLAGHMADTMRGGPGTLGDHGFTPLRRPLRTMSAADAIEEVALHMVSQFYEYSARPPVYMQVSEGLERQVRARSRATYDALEVDFGLAPEFLELLNWGPDRDANLKRFRDYFVRAEGAGEE